MSGTLSLPAERPSDGQSLESLRPVKAVLWDYDGCAADTEPQALRKLTDVLNQMLESKGCTALLDYDYVVKNLTGRTCRDILVEVAKSRNVSLTPAEVEHWVNQELEQNIEGFRKNVPPSPGVREAMAELKQLGLEMAIVSSSHGRRLEACVNTTGQSEFIEPGKIFSAQSSLPTPIPKPDPAIYLHAVQTLGREVADCIAIEDSRSGATAAVRAGILLVGFVGTEPEARRPERAEMLFTTGARWVIADMAKLPGIITRLADGDVASIDREHGREAWGH